MKLSNPFVELGLLGEDALAKGTDLLQLLLFVIKERLEVSPHVADRGHTGEKEVGHCGRECVLTV